MNYETLQNLLTLATEALVIGGFGGIILHAVYTSHTSWMATYCPPVKPYQPEAQEEAIAPNPEQLYCPINPDDYWASATPDGSSWEIATPLTCEWVAPAPPKRRRGKPRKQAA